TLSKSARCILTLIFLTSMSIIGYAQTITTNASDYPPGSTVTLTGSGWGANETVTVQVTHNPTCCDDSTAPDHQPWTVTADGSGNFVTTWWVPSDLDELGASLVATATGQNSNTASAYFTDSQNGSACITSVVAENGGCVVSTLDGQNQFWDVQE